MSEGAIPGFDARQIEAFVQDGYVRVDQEPQQVEQLFDAQRDPRELHDLSGDEPATLERLRGVADSYMKTPVDWGASPTREISELELGHLRALGYAIP